MNDRHGRISTWELGELLVLAIGHALDRGDLEDDPRGDRVEELAGLVMMQNDPTRNDDREDA